MSGESGVSELEQTAREIRRLAISMIYGAGSGHPGGCLSAADILAVLYGRELRIRPEDPTWAGRDRFVLSKGHSCPALYAALQLRGFFGRELLLSFRRLGGALQGEPDHRTTPGIDASTGSLGHGASIAAGLAMGLARLRSAARVHVMLGDGELQEGQVWESAMFASHHELDNLCAIIDYNKLQSDDRNASIIGLEPLAERWRSFGWHAIEVDGHRLDELGGAFADARETRRRPTVVIAHTVKGQGVSFMEDVPAWHGSVKLRPEEFERALRDLAVGEADRKVYEDVAR